MLPESRRHDVEELLTRATEWAAQQDDVRALLLVGSWARGNPRLDSDVDLILLTEHIERYLDATELVRALGAEQVVREQNWGAIEKRRLRPVSGLEVEVGIGEPSWASIQRIDEGTRRVVTDGARVLYDPDGLIGRLLLAGRSMSPRRPGTECRRLADCEGNSGVRSPCSTMTAGAALTQGRENGTYGGP
jgi:predicted nucleotidyltransferase